MRASILFVAPTVLAAVTLGACGGETEFVCDRSSSWNDFWCARRVAPAPPSGFLEGSAPSARIVNGTNGELSDDTARSWVLADLRRGRGENWAFEHFRRDVIDSDVFGPPGLNGTGDALGRLQGQGIVAIDCQAPPTELVAAGVFTVTRAERESAPGLELGEHVIVLLRRATGHPCERSFRDGRKEPTETTMAGALSWQLDTGEVRTDPVVGVLWYQARGWSCQPDDGSVTGAICGRVKQ